MRSYNINEENVNKLNFLIDENAALEIAKRSRGTPRIAIRLLKRVIDFSTVENLENINLISVETALKKMELR